MVSELDTNWYVSKTLGPQEDELWDLTLIREVSETFVTRVETSSQ